MKPNMLLVSNKFGDVWFWDQDYLNYIQKSEFLEQLHSYYSGVRELHNEHELLITLKDEDTHFVCYVPGGLNEEKNLLMKNMRRF